MPDHDVMIRSRNRAGPAARPEKSPLIRRT